MHATSKKLHLQGLFHAIKSSLISRPPQVFIRYYSDKSRGGGIK